MSIMNNNKSSNSSNNNNDDDTQSNTESANIGEETVVQLEEEEMIKKPTSCGKSCCKTILLLCAVILLSFFTSVVTTKYVLNALPTEIDDAGTSQQRRHADQLIPVSYSSRQIQYMFNMSLCMRKPTIWVPTRSDTNQPVQSQKQARS